MTDLKPYYQVKLALLTYKASFLYNPPKTEDEKYAYDIIEKTYWINEKDSKCLIIKRKLIYWRITTRNLTTRKRKEWRL